MQPERKRAAAFARRGPFQVENPVQVSFVSSVLLKKIATSVQTTPDNR